MYNRTEQLQDLAEGVKRSNQYEKDCIIVVRDGGFISQTNGGDGANEEGEDDELFQQYMHKVQAMRTLIASIDEGVKEINSLIELSASAVTNQQNEEVSTKLTDIIASTNEVCTQCKAAASILELGKSEGTPTEARMRENAYNVCIKHFQAAIKRYQDAQITFKKAIKERTARQVQLIYPELDSKELDRMMDSSKGHSMLEHIARSSIIGTASLTEAVQNIQSKYNDVLALEDSVEELHQMMIELAGVVSYQGDLIDQVEYNTMRAMEYTEKANVELTKALHNQRRSNRLMVYIMLGVIAAGLVIGVPIILKIT
ncbi:SNARE domain containing protein, putative [Babesia bigemina]|uniref:SNARE domain containing protein, putative n=1 Tax=Babesia bigemina TaxID=5866 RepID=A0A061D968_BABBI|nr:SNARE domain containing protein, putative [Babesia bigemina]CDR97236.1 SNARE domain containing protein, putative [Babesia bigemina]|eukprot:XP_012769422.1 SNARE domain containing protein, putative [Babesia bigemina]